MCFDLPTEPPRPLTVAELLWLSDFARADPARAAELLDRCADPLTEDRPARSRRRD